MRKKKHKFLRIALLLLFGSVLLALSVFMHFGGFGPGESADPEEFASYAGSVQDISIPKEARIIALGEATHGNAEFQELKLEVFKLLVEKYDVRAFALEGDYGGCEQVNRYIHGGEGTALEAAQAIGFKIYSTKEMAELISYMRQYNETAAPGEDLRFYGFDMRRYLYNFRFLTEACKKAGVDTENLEKLIDGEEWNRKYNYKERIQILSDVKAQLENLENTAQAVHFADILLQYLDFQEKSDTISQDSLATLRDKLMAENIKWIAEQESQSGHDRIFVAGHNKHVARWGSYDSMGALLADEIGKGYYVIGTDFYKTCCNLPVLPSGRRTNQVFYSHDPLANAAKKAGFDICWLDFSKISPDSPMADLVREYLYLGNLGEGYAWYMHLLPPSYRLFQPPAVLYDGMIFVTEATPIKIIDSK